MSFQIVCDSACDVPEDKLEKYNISVIPTIIMLDGGKEVYKEGELSYNEFLRRLQFKEYATTSQPSPADFKIVYDKLAEKDKPILSMHISSKLSGTLSNANLVSREYDNITIFDTLTISIASGYLVELAGFLRSRGRSLEETVEILERARSDLHLEILIEDIGYLKRGGRINFSKFALLSALRLKPLLNLVDGLLISKGFGISHRGALRTIAKRVMRFSPSRDFIYRLGYSTNIEDVNYLIEKIPQITNNNFEILTISTVLLAHTGPDASGVVIAPNFDSYLD